MAVSKRSSVEPDLEAIRLTVRMIREEPQWALSRVQRAAELEQRVQELEGLLREAGLGDLVE